MKLNTFISKKRVIIFQILLLVILNLISDGIKSQDIVDVCESTLKIGGLGGEEVFYYGFSEGDQMIFNFEEINGKELKEIEIMEFPASSKFMDYKSSKIQNKRIEISRTGIYKFRFLNSAVSGRICKVKIQRISPSENTKNFNTAVYWKTVYDTTYTILQEKYLVKTDTAILNLTDQIAKVHSQTNVNGSKTTFNFTIPANTIAWSYYIGVDQAGQQAYENAANQLASNASPLISRFPGYGPLAALALGSASYLAALQTGEDIDFYIVEGNNVNLFLSDQQFYYIKKCKVINDFSKMYTPLAGHYHVCLSNDNAITGVTVSVKIVAITVTQEWGQRPIQKMNVTSNEVPYLSN